MPHPVILVLDYAEFIVTGMVLVVHAWDLALRWRRRSAASLHAFPFDGISGHLISITSFGSLGAWLAGGMSGWAAFWFVVGLPYLLGGTGEILARKVLRGEHISSQTSQVVVTPVVDA